MEVVKSKAVEHRWEDLGYALDMGWSKLEDIKKLYKSDRQRMKAMLDDYMKSPNASWKKVATALKEIDSKLAYRVTTRYIRGMDVNYMTCLPNHPVCLHNMVSDHSLCLYVSH